MISVLETSYLTPVKYNFQNNIFKWSLWFNYIYRLMCPYDRKCPYTFMLQSFNVPL